MSKFVLRGNIYVTLVIIALLSSSISNSTDTQTFEGTLIIDNIFGEYKWLYDNKDISTFYDWYIFVYHLFTVIVSNNFNKISFLFESMVLLNRFWLNIS